MIDEAVRSIGMFREPLLPLDDMPSWFWLRPGNWPMAQNRIWRYRHDPNPQRSNHEQTRAA